MVLSITTIIRDKKKNTIVSRFIQCEFLSFFVKSVS